MAKQAKNNPKKQIQEAVPPLKHLMKEHLTSIAAEVIDQIMRTYRTVTTGQNLDAIKNLKPVGKAAYKAELIDALAGLTQDALDLARKEVPKAKDVKLADKFDKLTPSLQKKLTARADLLIGKQIGDLLSVIQFAYANNEDILDSEDQLEGELRDSAVGWLDSTSVQAGAELTASTVISDARDAFFFDPEVLEEIAAFEFVNGDPVTEICNDLAGTVFDKNDPNLFKYTPPLHWNCKSYIRPILEGNLDSALKRADQDEVEKLKPSSKRIEETIQFSECKPRSTPGLGVHEFGNEFVLEWIKCSLDRS